MGRVRFAGAVMANTLFAIFGTGVLERILMPLFRPQSPPAVLWKAWIASAILPAFIGYVVLRSWKSKTVKWAWVIPSILFAFRAFLYVGSRSGSLLFHFSGRECVTALRASDCRDFFLFTIPMVRGFSYSCAAYLGKLGAGPR
jgi:hypothetical protein